MKTFFFLPRVRTYFAMSWIFYLVSWSHVPLNVSLYNLWNQHKKLKLAKTIASHHSLTIDLSVFFISNRQILFSVFLGRVHTAGIDVHTKNSIIVSSGTFIILCTYFENICVKGNVFSPLNFLTVFSNRFELKNYFMFYFAKAWLLLNGKV